jgi:hypothetical protein
MNTMQEFIFIGPPPGRARLGVLYTLLYIELYQ